jgi:small subunit ribosomal protein S1
MQGMISMRDFRDAKAMARTLREALAAQGVTISNSAALELTARMLGQRDWNTLAAAIAAAQQREDAWARLEGVQARDGQVMGAIVGRQRGGFTVDLGGLPAFLPGTQVSVGRIGDIAALMGSPQPFAILKLDRPSGAVVVSRRAVLERSAP